MSVAEGCFGDDLPPLKSIPKGGKGIAPTNGQQQSVEPPAGSQIPGLNYCNAEFFPTHMEQVWSHYARPPDYKLIDKSGLKLMGEDAVSSYSEAARRWLLKENPRWDEKKIEAKVTGLRNQFIPGTKIEDAVLIATHYLAHELKYASSAEDPKSSGVSKPCFFLHFQRAHRLLFSFTAGVDITLDRELTVQRLNKQGVERANKGLKSLTAAKAAKDAKAENSVVSSRGTKSAKSARHKSSGKKNSSSGGGAMSMKPAGGGGGKGSNMFDDVDFGDTNKTAAAAPVAAAAADAAQMQ